MFDHIYWVYFYIWLGQSSQILSSWERNICTFSIHDIHEHTGALRIKDLAASSGLLAIGILFSCLLLV